MKKKTINAVICKKFDEFVGSIADDKVRELVKKNSIITGGSITSMLLKEDVNDFDIYFANKETVLAATKYYVDLFNKSSGSYAAVLDGGNEEQMGSYLSGGGTGLNMTSDRIKIIISSRGVAGEQPDETDEETNFQNHVQPIADADEIAFEEEITAAPDKPKYRPVFLSANAITLSDKIQIVIRFYGEPAAIHENYDYVHCTNYWYSKDRQVVLNQSALEAILSKELVYIGSKYPLCSIIRTRKFLKRGWTINAGQYLKMCFQVSKLDLTNIAVLEDQLIGVDVAYFAQLIEAVKTHIDKKNKEGHDFKLEYGYLATIIDKMF
jgi:hypothetical protein